MEILNSIIAAIIAGIVSSSKETASQAVKEAYVSFKNFIIERVNGVDFLDIEKTPESEGVQAEMLKSLEDNSKISDLKAIYEEAKNLLQEINQKDKGTITSLNIILEDIKVGGNFKWTGGKAGMENTNFTGKNMDVKNDFTIGDT